MHRAILLGFLLGVAPAFAQTAPIAPVEQAALAKDAFATGLLDRESGALPLDLWRGASKESLAFLLGALPSRPTSPAIGSAMRRVLLSPGESPGNAAALGGAKLKALVRMGLVEEAREIEALAAGAAGDPASVEAMAIADLLSNDQTAACEKGRRVDSSRDTPFWMRLRVLCYAASNELDAAELALGILGETGRLGDVDRTLFVPLASGGKPKAPVAPVDAVHLAALKTMKMPISAALLDRAEAGVVASLARDASADWPTRLDAARRAASMGAMSAADLKALYAAAPAAAAPAFAAISAMTGPEFLRDKAGRIAAEIAAARSFENLYAAALLYTDDLRAVEGAIVPVGEAASFALARLAVGDAVGAERWLAGVAPAMRQGASDEEVMRFIDLTGVLGALEPAAGGRVAAAANVSIGPLRAAAPTPGAGSADLARLVGAAIETAANGAVGGSALAALAASSGAAQGEAVAAEIERRSFAAAGLDDVVRRLKVEQAIRALYPENAAASASPAAAADGRTPRLKPKRES